MTDKNIHVMDLIIKNMARGDKLSQAMKKVYTKRNVAIPYKPELMSVQIKDMKMSLRTTRGLIKAGKHTIDDVVNSNRTENIMKIAGIGKASYVEFMTSVLDYSWEHMGAKERERFLIDTVERNANHIRENII